MPLIVLSLRWKHAANLSGTVRFNKATLFSWLYFFARINQIGKLSVQDTVQLILFIEEGKAKAREGAALPISNDLVHTQTFSRLLLLFHDRATSRVGDVSSVMVRDYVLWVGLLLYGKSSTKDFPWKSESCELRTAADILETLDRWRSEDTDSEGGQLSSSFGTLVDEQLRQRNWGVNL